MEKIIEIAQKHGGFITTSQVEKAGIPRARISDMVKLGTIARLQRGVYCLADSWTDEFLAAQLRFPKGIFSDDTALFLFNYTDRTPFSLTMTFPRSYRATTARESRIDVRTCADDVLDLGLTTLKTPYGNKVKAYNLERTLCDIFRGHKNIDVQVVNPAMKRFITNDRKKIPKLLEYASSMGVEKKIRHYLEVLL